MNATSNVNSTSSTSDVDSPNATNGVNTTDDTKVEGKSNVLVISLVTGIGISNLIIGLLLLTALLKLRFDKLKKTTRYFLVYQTLCHLLLGVVLIIRVFSVDFSCGYTAIIPCIGFLICCSTLLISIDSFICIHKPFTHKIILTTKRAKLAILFTIMMPLILLPVGVLTGKGLPENSVCRTVHDSFFTPAQIIAFMAIFLTVIVLSIVFQGWAMALIYRMNRVGPVPSNVENAHIAISEVHGREQAQKHLSASPKSEPAAGPSSSGNYLMTLQVTSHGALQSPEHSANTKRVVNIHVLKSSEKDVPTMNRLQCLWQVSTLHQNPNGKRPTRQKRLVRLLTAALILTVVAWSPAVLSTIIAATNDLIDIEKPAWFHTTKWLVASLVLLDGLLYPIIILALSSELKACLKSLFCKLCRRSGE